MSIKWVSGSPETLRAALEAFGEKATKAAAEALDETMKSAEADMKQVITDAHTPTGERRAAAGRGEAGRVESGDMRRMVRSRVSTRDDDRLIGEWGWLDGDVADYYEFQEAGTENIEKMNALFQSYTQAIPDLKRRLAEKGFTVQ